MVRETGELVSVAAALVHDGAFVIIAVAIVIDWLLVDNAAVTLVFALLFYNDLLAGVNIAVDYNIVAIATDHHAVAITNHAAITINIGLSSAA